MPSTVIVPERLNALLEKSELRHAVRLSLQDFEYWFEGSTADLFFFPEYTDHGPQHISAVMASAEALIRSESWPHLTPEDAAALILATLLHDCAMHLSADGFLDLIDPTHERNRELLKPIDTKTWPQLFDEFYLEARRWDQRILHNVVGDQARLFEEEEDLATYIRHPRENPNPEDWSVRYRKFIGEFVRRNHARLAHEIALWGVPGSSSHRLRLTRIPTPLADLAGLVARSHNMHLRDTFEYLKTRHYGRVKCSNSHPVFLMALLRIADYLEFRSDRVNPARPLIQRLRSPISQEEWNAHLAVHEVRPDEEDREAIFVVTRPETARTFLKIRHLLSGLQRELDTSWAVLGEVFSKQEELHQLGLILRRVRSNLDDLPQFIKTEKPQYVPIRAAFDSAGVDLLKLLVKPLYGNRPEIGVRELLQNALDAVHELRQWAAERGDPSWPAKNHEADVSISIDRGPERASWLTISDRGIGMTADTICNYFLKAGASYRQSEVWRRSFEVDGKSKVLRSGRFGIGALAAFLLGNRIEVSTRHASAPAHEALQFCASIEDEAVELRREERKEIGTTIRVRLTPFAAKVLKSAQYQHEWDNVEATRTRHPWDWYTLDDPKLERLAYGALLEQGYHTPHPSLQSPPSDWRRINVEGYQGVFWTYSYAPDLICNGIRIESYRHERQRKAQRRKLLGSSFAFISRPSVSVFDRDGMLPLNLQRNEVETGELPFSSELLKDVLADLFAFLLVHSPQNRESAEKWLLNCKTPLQPLVHDQLYIDRLWVTGEGIAITYPWHLRRSQIRRGVLALHKGFRIRQPIAIPIPSEGGLFFGTLDSDHRLPSLEDLLRDFGLVGYRTVTPSGWMTSDDDHKLTLINKGLALTEVGTLQDDILPQWLPRFMKKTKDLTAVVDLHFDPERAKAPESAFTEFFDEIVDAPIIPFNMEARRANLPRAFHKLREYIEAWEAANLEGWRESLVRQLLAPREGKLDVKFYLAASRLFDSRR